MLEFLANIRIVDVIDIVLVAVIFYRILILIKGTRAVQIITGLALLFFIFLVSKQFGLLTFQWLVGNFLAYIIVIMVIIFQTEIRAGLARIGRYRFFRSTSMVKKEILNEVIDFVQYLSEKRRGAIIVIERDVGLKDIAERGTTVDAKLSLDLLKSITNPDVPLHDGAIIISGDRVVSAGVILPITHDVMSLPLRGARHRAALSITYESDAVSVVVSEENGDVTLYVERNDRKISTREDLELILFRIFAVSRGKEKEPEEKVIHDAETAARDSISISESKARVSEE